MGGSFPPHHASVIRENTFKGMTDAMLDWQTQRFTELADGPTDGCVLRFARVLRYRDDKRPDEATPSTRCAPSTRASRREVQPAKQMICSCLFSGSRKFSDEPKS
jgi:hypothetical protein